MPELALHILDLVQNSISAGAKHIIVTISQNSGSDVLTIIIEDDGCGMTEEFVARVISPFATTRTTRKIGLGIPLFKQLAEMCGGGLEIVSQQGKGTRLIAHFQSSHLDLPPLGDLAGTIQTLIIGCPEETEFRIVYQLDDEQFVLDTSEMRAVLGGLPLNSPEIVQWIGQYAKEGIHEVEHPSQES